MKTAMLQALGLAEVVMDMVTHADSGDWPTWIQILPPSLARAVWPGQFNLTSSPKSESVQWS